MTEIHEKKLGTMALTALVVSAMIGGGVFSLPQNMAQNAAVMPIILAWAITGLGIFFIANTFRILSGGCPENTTGIYSYARAGFGPFGGFQMAWAYYLSNIFGNVGYAVLLMDAFNYFFPGVFTGGNNIWSILGGSILIWVMNYAVLRGTHQAAFINTIGTLFKLFPLFLFIIILIFTFRIGIFTKDMWGQLSIPSLDLKPLGSGFDQIKSTMLVTLWAFIGIEGAVVVSGRAKNPNSVGRATIAGFLICLVIYTLLSVLPFGRMTQGAIAGLENPSTAPILESIVGKWGGVLMNLGVIIALLTSYLAFTIMIAQIPYAAAMDGTFPKVFRKENIHETPSVSLIVTSCLMQLTMIFVYFAGNAWNTMLSITGIMILPPYLASTAYLWKRCLAPDHSKNPFFKGFFPLFCGIAGSFFALWMIYSAGLKYLLMAFIFQLFGLPVYFWACRERREEELRKNKPLTPYLTDREFLAAILIVLIAVIAIIVFAAGKVKL